MNDRSRLEKIRKFDLGNFDTSSNSCNNNNEGSMDTREKMDNFVETSTDRTIQSDTKNFTTSRKWSDLNWREKLYEKFKNGRKIFSKMDNRECDNSTKNNIRKIAPPSSPTIFDPPSTMDKTIDYIDDRIEEMEMRSANKMTTQAVVEMCNRVYTVLGDIRCESTDLDDPLTSTINSLDSRKRDNTRQPELETSDDDSLDMILESFDRSIIVNPRTLRSSTRNLPTNPIAGKHEASNFDEKWENIDLHCPIVESSFDNDGTLNVEKNSSILDRSVKIYRSLSQRIRSKFQSRPITRESPPMGITACSMRHNDRIQELLKEAKIQQILMDQATKAVNVCNASKEFIDSSERIESERLMLLADLRKKAVMREIRRITSEDNDKKVDDSMGVTAEITIEDVNLNLRKSFKNDFQEGEIMEWFMVIVTQGLKVWATRAICCPIRDSRIRFPESMSIRNLRPDFKINVEIYSLKLRKLTYNHEDKYRIRKSSKSTSRLPCVNIIESPKKVLKKFERASASEIRTDHMIDIKLRDTSFMLVGFTQFILDDLSSETSWELILVQDNTILKKTIDLNIACRLDLSIDHEGFIDHGRDNGDFVSWNRFWCVLRGHNLMFWNYPREQDSKDPTMTIDLSKCITDKIDVVDRTFCGRSRTLIIKTTRTMSNYDRDIKRVEDQRRIIKDLLHYDSLREMKEWSLKLNRVISILREWKIIDIE